MIITKKALAKDEQRAYHKAWYYSVETFEEAQKALRFTLSLPVTAAVTPGHEKFFDWACEIADDYSPITDGELNQLKKKAKELTPVFPEN